MSKWIVTSLEAVLGDSIRRNLAGSSPSTSNKAPEPKKEEKSSWGSRYPGELVFAPQFDWVNPFDTIITKPETIHSSPSASNKAPEAKKEVKSSWGSRYAGELVFAPQYDWVNPFDTIIRKPEPIPSSPPAVKKREDGPPRELVFAPEFDWVNPFDTLISRPRK